MYSDSDFNFDFDLLLKESEAIKTFPKYHNIMEDLVNLEVKRQIKKLPEHLQRYIKPIEVTTYALNRLPPLYASSQKGKIEQEKYAKHKLRENIIKTVTDAISIIEEDPYRNSIPLVEEINTEYQVASLALEKVQNYLKKLNLLYQGRLTWNNLLDAVKYAIENISYLEITKIHKQDLAKRFEKWNDRDEL